MFVRKKMQAHRDRIIGAKSTKSIFVIIFSAVIVRGFVFSLDVTAALKGVQPRHCPI